MISRGEKFIASDWILLKHPGKASIAFNGLKLVFSELVYAPYAVLTINKDPGLAIVLSGALIFILSLVGLLFIKGEGMELVRRQT